MTSQLVEIIVTRDHFVRMQEQHFQIMMESHHRHEKHESACRAGDVLAAMPHAGMVLVMLTFVRCVISRRR